MDELARFYGRLGAYVVACAAVIFPLAAAAQDEPAAGVPPDVPSYARPADATADETIRGRIRSVDGAFTITVADDRGFVDTVQLHPGTIINPTGLSLSPGMSVTILGFNGGAVFNANEIDTPYTYDGPLPEPVYYGPGYWCPGFAYGYGPAFNLAIVFGGGGYGPWSYEQRPFYGRPWNGQTYFGGYVGAAPLDRGRIPANRLPVSPHGRTPTSVERGGNTSSAPPQVRIFSRSQIGRSAVVPDDYRSPAEGYSRPPAEGSYRAAPEGGSRAPSAGYSRTPAAAGSASRSTGAVHSGGVSAHSGGHSH
jgi:hypothetical protein